jgi:hypothetical protein
VLTYTLVLAVRFDAVPDDDVIDALGAPPPGPRT